jgi:hypothetical protein
MSGPKGLTRTLKNRRILGKCSSLHGLPPFLRPCLLLTFVHPPSVFRVQRCLHACVQPAPSSPSVDVPWMSDGRHTRATSRAMAATAATPPATKPRAPGVGRGRGELWAPRQARWRQLADGCSNAFGRAAASRRCDEIHWERMHYVASPRHTLQHIPTWLRGHPWAQPCGACKGLLRTFEMVRNDQVWSKLEPFLDGQQRWHLV